MTGLMVDVFRAIVEAIRDLFDAVARVPARAFVYTALIVIAVTMFSAIGPH